MLSCNNTISHEGWIKYLSKITFFGKPHTCHGQDTKDAFKLSLPLLLGRYCHLSARAAHISTCNLRYKPFFPLAFVVVAMPQYCADNGATVTYWKKRDVCTPKAGWRGEGERYQDEAVMACAHSPAGHLQEAVPSERVRQVELFRQGLWRGSQGS